MIFHWAHFFMTMGVIVGLLAFAVVSGELVGWLQSKAISPFWYLGVFIVVISALTALV